MESRRKNPNPDNAVVAQDGDILPNTNSESINYSLKNEIAIRDIAIKPTVKKMIDSSLLPIKQASIIKFVPKCGYTTLQGRLDWIGAHGITDPEKIAEISVSFVADSNLENPIYFWQLYSLLGKSNIRALVSSFYQRVYADVDEKWFKHAFSRISGIEHHINTQTAFWIDSMGGGESYHGADFRLNFHHQHNAVEVMNARGATRWMFHMRLALTSHATTFDIIDKRIVPCIMDFLRTKMLKYADIHSWKFDEADFVIQK